jgi:hypothetical protein
VRAQGRHNILFFDLLLNSLSHLDETFFDASGGLGRSLQEQQVVGVSKLFSSLELDLSFSNKIALVTNQQFVNVLASVTVDLQQPLLNVVECLCICNIVDDNNAVSTTVVAAGNSSETLLTSSIPNLKLNYGAVDLDGSDFLKNIQVSIIIILRFCVLLRLYELNMLIYAMYLVLDYY